MINVISVGKIPIECFSVNKPSEQSIYSPYKKDLTKLQLNKSNSFDTEAPFLDLELFLTNGIVSSKIYYKRDDFNFEIIYFTFLDEDVPGSPSYGVYISQLIRESLVRLFIPVVDNMSI